MPNFRTPRGITPPAPGLDREEPTFVPEQDLPESEGGRASSDAGREDRPAARNNERE
jgi:hypothetical protein